MNPKLIQVFEHQTLKVGDRPNDVQFEVKHFEALQRLAGTKGSLFFSLVHNGVKFNKYVGVISVGSLVIEVLPKADKESNDVNLWQSVLIQMLRESGYLKVSSLSEANLKVKANHILDLYIELFLVEIEFLIHQGLAKNYRSISKNANALKGPISFAKHLQQNIVHQERFYIRSQVYDTQNVIHQIFWQALELLPLITHSTLLNDRIKRVQLAFPEMPWIRISESLFNRVKLSRKTQRYSSALQIAKLLLLNYYPDLSKGSNSVLAILFDMNVLWENFIFKRLTRVAGLETVQKQVKKSFWQSKSIKPDIVIRKKSGEILVLDTKWKVIEDRTPSDDDLKQIFVYNHYFQSKRGILLYPSVFEEGLFPGHYHTLDSSCEVAFVKIFDEQEKLSSQIGDQIAALL